MSGCKYYLLTYLQKGKVHTNQQTHAEDILSAYNSENATEKYYEETDNDEIEFKVSRAKKYVLFDVDTGQ
jgi:hypothetical protein